MYRLLVQHQSPVSKFRYCVVKKMAKQFVEIGPGFWQFRDDLYMAGGLLNIKTHMAMIKLNNGKFLVIDTCKLDGAVKAQFDQLTRNGELIEGVVATHAYHTLYFEPFHKQYPHAQYYGTPRHLQRITSIPWAGDITNAAVRAQWESHGVYMRIPAGVELIPKDDNHFAGMFVFHRGSRSMFIDDTIMVFDNPGCLLRLAGARAGAVNFHMEMNQALTYKEAPGEFIAFMESLVNDWDFDNLLTAHTGNKIGGAKQALSQLINETKPKLESLAKKLPPRRT